MSVVVNTCVPYSVSTGCYFDDTGNTLFTSDIQLVSYHQQPW